MAAHSGILARQIPWTEEAGGLQSMGLRRVGRNLVTKKQQQRLTWRDQVLRNQKKICRISGKLPRLSLSLKIGSWRLSLL